MSASQKTLRTFPLVIAVVGADIACAQTFPQKPIRLVTTGVGGSSDTASRLIAQEISAPLGQPVVVENRPTAILPEFVAKAPPDGYTLMITANVLWTAPLVEKTA